MNSHAPIDAYGALDPDKALRICRLLPGPAERIWAYLTESGKRARWLASGEMDLTPGAPFTLTWRNDELTDPPGERPEGADAEHSLACRIIEAEPPHKLVFAWGDDGQVDVALEPQGDEVLLTLVHRGAKDRAMLISVSAGWHSHLDLLAARVAGGPPIEPFWDQYLRVKADYAARHPA